MLITRITIEEKRIGQERERFFALPDLVSF